MKDWQNFKYTVWIRQTTACTNAGSAKRGGMKCKSSTPALPRARKRIFCKTRGNNCIHRSQPRLAKLNCVFNRLHIQMFHPHTSNLLLRAELHILFTCFSEGNFFLSAYSTHLYPNFTLYSEIFKKNKGHEGCCYFFFFQQQ